MKLNNKILETKIEEKINEISNIFSKTNKLDIELNFYQTVTNSFIFSQKLTNLWESWKFHFLLNVKHDSNIIKNESENQKLKENKIRKYLFEIIEKVSFRFNIFFFLLKNY